MDGGHHRAATGMASSAALAQPSPNDLSVYGTLLLRGAVAAAQHSNRHTAAELLDEADDSATTATTCGPRSARTTSCATA
ncbi:hypothetical protein AB0C08_29155 [Microbispora bryophytorum]|uniref:hypothetical protein n=1 Tax=Microbispora bryophytorum TaxID=1460882 RepID=UPI0033DD2CDE